MNLVRLQGLANCGGFSHGGMSYPADEDGVIEVPSEIVSFALHHGFTSVTTPRVERKLAKADTGEEKPEDAAEAAQSEEADTGEEKPKLRLGKQGGK